MCLTSLSDSWVLLYLMPVSVVYVIAVVSEDLHGCRLRLCPSLSPSPTNTAPPCRWAEASFNVSSHIDLIPLTCLSSSAAF